MTTRVFLLTPDTQVPNDFFDGFCFVGSDFVVDGAGADEFSKVTGRAILPGEDGCYVTIRRTPSGHDVGVDFNGYQKLFYYSRGAEWAVSNSFAVLAQHLHEQGRRLTVNKAQLQSWFLSGSIGGQLTSFATAINEIRLLPSYCYLELSRGRLAVRPLTLRGGSLPVSYRAALSEAAELWLARIEGLLSRPDLTIGVDVTGGRDSRVVLAFILRALERLQIAPPDHLYFRSGTTQREAADLRVASILAERHHLPLNRKAPSPARLGAAEAYRLWRQLCLGVYGPIYLPFMQHEPRQIYFQGTGGEAHRPFYPVGDLARFLDDKARELGGGTLARRWKRQVRADIAQLQRHAGDIDPMILHYREFRDRCHGGRSPQSRVTVTPLAGAGLLAASRLCPRPALERSQVLYDTMETLMPGISLLPFDKPEKTPTSANLDALVRADVRRAPNPGRIFIGEVSRAQSRDFAPPPDDVIAALAPTSDGASKFDLLAADLRRSMDKLPKGMFPSAFVYEALKACEAAQQRGRLGHATEGRPISHLLLAAFVNDMCAATSPGAVSRALTGASDAWQRLFAQADSPRGAVASKS